MIKAPLPAAKSNRGLFGGTNSALVAVEGTPKSKKMPLKLGEIDLNRPLIDSNNNKSKNKDKRSIDKDNDNDSNHGSVVVTPEPKPAATSIFSNLFTNQNKTTIKNSTSNEENDNVNKNKYAEKEHKDDDAATAAQKSKRKYTQFGYFSHRPSCVADSDFVTIVISGIEISDLFYVDRLWSPKPYLEISVGKRRGVCTDYYMSIYYTDILFCWILKILR